MVYDKREILLNRISQISHWYNPIHILLFTTILWILSTFKVITCRIIVLNLLALKYNWLFYIFLWKITNSFLILIFYNFIIVFKWLIEKKWFCNSNKSIHNRPIKVKNICEYVDRICRSNYEKQEGFISANINSNLDGIVGVNYALINIKIIDIDKYNG